MLLTDQALADHPGSALPTLPTASGFIVPRGVVAALGEGNIMAGTHVLARA
jgi:hypothetical protein